MNSDVNTILLSTHAYNQIKSDNTKYEMLLESILLNGELSDDHQKLVFDSEVVRIAVQFCFPERYKKKLATLKTQYNRNGLKGEEDDSTTDV